MSSRIIGMDSLIELEESIAGKPGGPWVTPSNNTQLSLLAISLALACGLLGGMWEGYLPNGFFELVAKAESEGASSQYALVFSAISALVIVFAWWVTFTALIKWTPGKTRATAMLGIATAWIIVVAVRGFSHFVLVEADWDVVWANRVLLVIGQQMTEQMTQAPGSESCISTCYGINQNWRLWWVLYPTFAVVASAYGTAAEKPARFLVPFSLVVFGLMAVAWTPSEINYHREVPMTNLAKAVLGFGIGVVLAFGRQSKQPFFSMPSIAVIELVRSGPLICWLWFAVFLMPDMMDPFYDAEDIIRMLLMFGIFGGCYIAEVLRGGLQAVDSGQKEAAVALGLSPFQTKMQVELPNAVRTTLPSIVSVFIGLWKDTTLLFIINILDFFKLAKDLPATDLRFLGNFLEPLYVTAFVFWVFAFYLSRISMKIEKGLGLGIEGGGEAA